MSNAGSALMGIGSARGEDRALQAAEMAISSPLLEASIDGAHGVLLSIAGGSDLGIFEINEAAAMVADSVHEDANIIFGTIIDDALGDEVRVTVIAAGFDGGLPKRRDESAARRQQAAAVASRPAAPAPAASTPRQEQSAAPASPTRDDAPVEPQPVGARTTPAPMQFDDGDDLDVPDFLK
jgi:cell division protein FtsZ